MGLDIDRCWHGAYSAFMRFREVVCQCAGLGDIHKREHFVEGGLPWPDEKDSPIVILLDHSDCDGEIKWKDAKPLADALEQLLPSLRNAGDGGGHIGYYEEKAKEFIEGLRWHHENKKNVEFH